MIRTFFKKLRWRLFGNTAWARLKRGPDGNPVVEFTNFTDGPLDVHVTVTTSEP